MPVNPDVKTYALALLLALVSGFLFGLVPVRQVLRADPWQIIRSGSSGAGRWRRFTLRDALLGLQIAICAVLITASLVAVRGLARSLQSNYGFDPQGAMLVKTDLHMGGYDGDQQAQMQRRMLDAAAAIPGVTAAGYSDRLPLEHRRQRLLRLCRQHHRLPAHEMPSPMRSSSVSPRTTSAQPAPRSWPGRTFTLHDEAKAPLVAVVNREFARKLFGSVEKAVGGHFKRWGGARVEVVGVVEDGKYETLTETPQPAMFYSFLQQPSGSTWIIVRSQHAPEEIAGALQQSLRRLDPALPLEIRAGTPNSIPLSSPRVWPRWLWVCWDVLGAMLAITGIFGMASYAVSKRLRELGIRIALGANRREVLGAALGRAFRLLAIGSAAGIILGVLATRVLSYIVYQATPKDPIVLGGVILSMLAVGLVAAWIPARHALAVDPMILLREE